MPTLPSRTLHGGGGGGGAGDCASDMSTSDESTASIMGVQGIASLLELRCLNPSDRWIDGHLEAPVALLGVSCTPISRNPPSDDSHGAPHSRADSETKHGTSVLSGS